MKQQPRIDGRKRIETEGGPVLLGPVSRITSWTGHNGDYDLVIEMTDAGHSECCDVPGKGVVVLGDEPLATTVIESRSLIVQWIHGDSEEDMRRYASEVDVDTVAWRQGPALDCDGNLALIDSATPGGEVTEEDMLVFPLEAGAYRIDSAEVPLAPHYAAKLHYLVPLMSWAAPAACATGGGTCR
ncbi:Imm21 family immunity protein [Streptomyces glaucus]|uniref:Immunity 21 family protein n=1 Tax=Streptomyces glaucus TaxID=284029 RepID=A0ABN3K349_9ACTN